MVPINFKFVKSNIPKYTRTIKSMQEVLKALGYFPNNQDCTGLWYSLTDIAVKKFCINYGITFMEGRKMWKELEDKLLFFQ